MDSESGVSLRWQLEPGASVSNSCTQERFGSDLDIKEPALLIAYWPGAWKLIEEVPGQRRSLRKL
jgi:hypothetical protein